MENFEELLNKIDTDIKNILSEKRYIHSVGVMNKAKKLAEKYGESVERAMLVGLAHDIAKEMSDEEKLQYVKENNIEIDDIEKINIGLLHAKIGADICKKQYGFTLEMQNAIIRHTVGSKDITTLDKIIIVSDKTEEGRKYEDLEHVNYLANKDLDDAVIYIMNVAIQKTIEKGALIHPIGVETRNYLIQNKMVK